MRQALRPFQPLKMWRMKRKRKTMKTMSPLRVGSSLRTGEPVDTVRTAHMVIMVR